MDGPQPEGGKTTVAINIFDLVLLKVENSVGTPDYLWREPSPNSENCTRILGSVFLQLLIHMGQFLQDGNFCYLMLLF